MPQPERFILGRSPVDSNPHREEIRNEEYAIENAEVLSPISCSRTPIFVLELPIPHSLFLIPYCRTRQNCQQNTDSAKEVLRCALACSDQSVVEAAITAIRLLLAGRPDESLQLLSDWHSLCVVPSATFVPVTVVIMGNSNRAWQKRFRSSFKTR